MKTIKPKFFELIFWSKIWFCLPVCMFNELNCKSHQMLNRLKGISGFNDTNGPHNIDQALRHSNALSMDWLTHHRLCKHK